MEESTDFKFMAIFLMQNYTTIKNSKFFKYVNYKDFLILFDYL